MVALLLTLFMTCMCWAGHYTPRAIFNALDAPGTVYIPGTGSLNSKTRVKYVGGLRCQAYTEERSGVKAQYSCMVFEDEINSKQIYNSFKFIQHKMRQTAEGTIYQKSVGGLVCTKTVSLPPSEHTNYKCAFTK